MYCRLKADLLRATTTLQHASHGGTYLTTGALLPPQTVGPFKFRVEMEEPDGDESEFEGVVGLQDMLAQMDAYYPNSCVMHSDLVKVLADAGVDNLQTFPAIIEPNYEEMTFRVEKGIQILGYLVVNILGLVSCASLADSVFDELGDSKVFHELVIDAGRARDLLFFRLAEYPPDIIVHRRVASRLLARGFKGLVLDDLKAV